MGHPLSGCVSHFGSFLIFQEYHNGSLGRSQYQGLGMILCDSYSEALKSVTSHTRGNGTFNPFHGSKLCDYILSPAKQFPSPCGTWHWLAPPSCWWCWLERWSYFMWCHLTLSPLQRKTKTCMEPKVGVQLSSVWAGHETVPCAWLGNTRSWLWRVGPLRKKWMNCLESEGEGVLPENNLREVMGLLTRIDEIHENKQWDCWHPDFAWMRIANGFPSKQDHLTCYTWQRL